MAKLISQETNLLIYASSKESDMLYAARVFITDPFFWFDAGKEQYIFLDDREYEFFKQENTNARLTPLRLNILDKETRKNKEKTSGANKLAFALFTLYQLWDKPVEVPAHFPLPMADYLRSKGALLAPRVPFFPERARKSKRELEEIKESIKKTQEAFAFIESVLAKSAIQGNRVIYNKRTLTSEWLKNEVEKLLFEKGMVCSEGMIISSGNDSAIPHHPGKGPILPHQPIVCDIFPHSKKSGYFADITRTYVKGTPSQRILAMENAVKAAQKKAIAAVRPGSRGADIHELCAFILVKHGFHAGAKGFIHATGHGIGLDVHEEPSLGPNSRALLEESNVVTVEPGLYYPSMGGIRIEDIVLVTKTGNHILTTPPKRFVIP